MIIEIDDSKFIVAVKKPVGMNGQISIGTTHTGKRIIAYIFLDEGDD